MSEHPILFSGEMVRAILAGRKTQTRRVIKKEYQHADKWEPSGWQARTHPNIPEAPKYFTPQRKLNPNGKLWSYNLIALTSAVFCPYGVPGDTLWVRETWAGDDFTGFAYKASEPDALPFGEECVFDKWKPSIHMPRAASRITLEVVSVRVERVQEITEEDIRAEGTPTPNPPPNNWMDDSKWRATFAQLWDSINEKRGYGWDVNPWVWVVEFKPMMETETK